MDKHYCINVTSTYLVKAPSVKAAVKAFKDGKMQPVEAEGTIVCEETGDEEPIEF